MTTSERDPLSGDGQTPTSSPSRRAILAAAVGGLGALTASALAAPAVALAGADGDVILGELNGTTTTTGIASSGTGAALQATTSSATGWAIHATSTDYPTVFADSTGNAALYGVGHGSNGAVVGEGLGTGPGVLGSAGVNHPTPPSNSGIFGYGVQGVVGQSDGSVGYVGVQGFSGAGDATIPPPVTYTLPTGTYGEAAGADPTGVWGQGGAATSGSSTGVYGEGDTGVWGYGGWGVFGASTGGTGVYGFAGASVPAAPAHTGVFGYSDSGTGVYAKAATGIALNVSGKAKFSRSGKVGITAGHASYTKTLAGVTTSSLIFAVLQTYRSGYYVVAAVPAAGKFTIRLNKSVTATTYVAYFVVN